MTLIVNRLSHPDSVLTRAERSLLMRVRTGVYRTPRRDNRPLRLVFRRLGRGVISLRFSAPCSRHTLPPLVEMLAAAGPCQD